MEDSFEIEDLIEKFNKKEGRKNSNKKKGNRGENQLAELLCHRFQNHQFFRVVGSGNRWSHVTLTEETKTAFTGDIVCPSNFNFCVECKYGYETLELCGIFPDGHKKIDEWLKKAKRDAESLGKKPLLCWRKPRQHWLAFIERDSLPLTPEFFLSYANTWTMVSLDWLLQLPDNFWFK